FRNRFSHKADDGWAALYVLGLIAFFVLVIPVFVMLSFGLLRSKGIWLSPIPIAVGMFIDSFVSGSVAQAVREASPSPPKGAPVGEVKDPRQVAPWLIFQVVWIIVVLYGLYEITLSLPWLIFQVVWIIVVLYKLYEIKLKLYGH